MAKKPKKSTKQLRQPIITILGHVDHGKTTLLDYIKKTHLVKKEAGGITQSIGAYQAEFKSHKLTFIDTPGHAAFSKMRSRGANLADLAILVVAADDGVKPQTIESISHLKAADIPYIVALNKIDSPGSNIEVAKAQLTEHEVFVDGYGGNTPVVEISAKEGTGIDNLLENIILLAELEELPYDDKSPLEAVIIEAQKHQKKGILVNAILIKGQLAVQDEIKAGSALGKVKALFDENTKKVSLVKPGEPVQILGFKSLPEVGETITLASHTLKVTSDSTSEESVPEEVLDEVPETTDEPATEDISEDDSSAIENEDEPVVTPSPPAAIEKINIILKADTLGSLEAIKGSFTEEINLILSGTGDITESDVLLGATTGSLVFGFNVKFPNSVKTLADTEVVTVKTYRIIYELLEYLEKKVLKLIEPTIDEEVLGEAKILKIFEINKNKIAGCKITSGVITVGDTVHLKRDGEIIKDSKVKFIKTGKEELKKIKAGSECGILLTAKLDIKENDVIIAYNKKQEEE